MHFCDTRLSLLHLLLKFDSLRYVEQIAKNHSFGHSSCGFSLRPVISQSPVCDVQLTDSVLVSLIVLHHSLTALLLFVGQQQRHPAYKLASPVTRPRAGSGVVRMDPLHFLADVVQGD